MLSNISNFFIISHTIHTLFRFVSFLKLRMHHSSKLYAYINRRRSSTAGIPQASQLI